MKKQPKVTRTPRTIMSFEQIIRACARSLILDVDEGKARPLFYGREIEYVGAPLTGAKLRQITTSHDRLRDTGVLGRTEHPNNAERP